MANPGIKLAAVNQVIGELKHDAAVSFREGKGWYVDELSGPCCPSTLGCRQARGH